MIGLAALALGIALVGLIAIGTMTSRSRAGARAATRGGDSDVLMMSPGAVTPDHGHHHKHDSHDAGGPGDVGGDSGGGGDGGGGGD